MLAQFIHKIKYLIRADFSSFEENATTFCNLISPNLKLGIVNIDLFDSWSVPKNPTDNFAFFVIIFLL